MNILKESDPMIIGFLGGYQKRFKNVKYRFTKCLIETKYEDRIILYNTLTGAVVSLFDFEYDNIHTELPCDYSSFLYGNYFLVRENFDENQIIDDYKKTNVHYIGPTYLDTPSHFTILTTSKCNACCTYCYEQLLPNKHHMNEETAKDIVKYIIENSNINEPLTIEWFGGEPLYNNKIIDIISSTICSAGLNFTSNIVSNGYLFNNDIIIAKAKNIWKVRDVQITLDGTKEKYNETKRYIYKYDPNPFQTVINNIHRLLKANIHVTIRLNCDKNNYKNLLELINYINKEFNGYNNISIYAFEIFSEEKRSEENANEQFKAMDEVDIAIIKSGMAINEEIYGIKSQHCIVDGGRGVCINPDGKLFLCEHHLDNDFFSDIYHPEIKDFEVFKNWRNFTDNHSEQCINCPLRPTCLKVHRCTDQYECIGYEQQYRINHIKRHLILMQDRFNQSFDCDNSCCTQN